MDTNFSQALNTFVEMINEATKNYATKNYENLYWSDDHSNKDAYFFPITLDFGKRYVRLVQHNGSSRSVYCFVDQTNGDILKASSWKIPAKGKRASIFQLDKLQNIKQLLQSGQWLYR
jgi:hypothetical protein